MSQHELATHKYEIVTITVVHCLSLVSGYRTKWRAGCRQPTATPGIGCSGRLGPSVARHSEMRGEENVRGSDAVGSRPKGGSISSCIRVVGSVIRDLLRDRLVGERPPAKAMPLTGCPASMRESITARDSLREWSARPAAWVWRRHAIRHGHLSAPVRALVSQRMFDRVCDELSRSNHQGVVAGPRGLLRG